MNFQTELLNIKKAVDRELERFFSQKKKLVAKSDFITAEAFEYLGILTLGGGKRLRPALFLNCCKIKNVTEAKAALKIATALELVHMYLLIHDDIIDFGSVRHGQMTAQLRYAGWAKKFFGARNEHFGNSMAIVMGDMLYAYALEMIAESGMEAKKNQQIISLVQKVVAQTIIGQVQDISIENRKNPSREDVLAMYCNKTAQYTFQGPLRAGLLFSGNVDEKLAKALDKYAINLGIAFQIRDDIIGIFGDKSKTGKEIGIDIAEGKKTLLVLDAFELADAKQKNMLKKLLGKKDISWKEIKEFQKILIDCGALETAQKQVEAYSSKAKKFLESINVPAEQKSFLLSLAEHLEKRQS